jgi:hypothetical protein
MADEATEQIPAVETEQVAPSEEQATAPVAASESAPVATDDGAVAESVVIDWSNPDNIRGVLESPEYKGVRDLLEEARLNGENTGKQKTEAELRRQAASDEVLTDAAKRLALELGVEADDERVRQYAQAFTKPFIDRNQIEINKLYIEGAKSSFSPDAQAAIDMAVEQAGDDGEALGSIVTQLWQYRDTSAREDALNSTSLEDIPEGSKLRKDIDAYVAKQLESELKARNIENTRQEAAPRTSSGRPAGVLTLETLKSMSREEIATVDKAEVDRVLSGA